ncbi:DUF4424 family protein [Roseobacter sp. HKCCA0882]|uniref:DUF4424 family protein n=1 Tax=Roseobacter sp. HKCCA0882 TaxID=3120337 RepID=UPI0030EBDB09
MRRAAVSYLYALICVGISIAVATSASANDSEGGRTATGGLEFLQNEHIRIQSEDLFISEDLIRVEYTYENTHFADVEIQIAFPIQLDCSEWGEEIAVHECISRLQFQTWVNGEEISWFPYVGSNVQQGDVCRSLWFERNEIFNRYGYCFTSVSGQAVFDNSDCSTNIPKLSDADEFRVSELSVIEQESGCSIEPVIQQVSPFENTEWVNAEDYVSIMRNQVFPANSLTKVVHEYRPDVGSGVPWKVWDEPPSLRSDADWVLEAEDEGEFFGQFRCVSLTEYNSAIQSWQDMEIEGRPSHADASAWALSDNWLSYVLVTGSNWSGSIGHFRLEVTTDEREIVNTCFNGLQRVSDTSLVFEADDFVPTQNLHIRFNSLVRW